MEQHRYDKLQKLREMGVNPFVSSFNVTITLNELSERFEQADAEALLADKQTFTIAGRIMAARSFGKAGFCTLKDRTGSFQIYVAKKDLSDEEFTIFGESEVGDFVGVTGYLFKTKTGELTLYAEKFSLLTKSLRDLPEKYHGLKDVETRYRRRYVDLIVNDEVRDIFKKRSAVIRELRNWFAENDYIEVETPMMHPIAGGAAAKPFITHHNALDMEFYLRIAPELYLKRLVVGGMERVFEVNRNFRNEGISTRHNPEFTMVEWYTAYINYHQAMDQVEDFVKRIAEKVAGSTVVPFNGNDIDLGTPWARLNMEEAIEKYSDITKDKLATLESAKAVAENIGIKLEKEWGRGKIVLEIFEALVETKLIQPTFIIDYPKEVSPLAKSNPENPEITERFELFIGGMEFANGFNELNDPIDQYERFSKQVENRESGDDEAHMMDTDFIRALEYGLPPTAGVGMGIDRLVMLITNQSTIREVLLFPHMRPEDAE